MSKILSLDEIMAAHDITEQEIAVPEWGGSVVVRSISHYEMREIKKKVKSSVGNDEEPDEDEVEKWVLIKGMVQPQIDEGQYELLLQKSTTAVNKVLAGILRNSNAGEKDVKEEERQFPSESE